MSLTQLRQKIHDKTAVLGVVGLGYVGLPVAAMFARAGLRVVGVDIKSDRVATINAGRNPIEGEEPGLGELLAEVVGARRLSAATDYAKLMQADIVLIDVETPVDDVHKPRYVALKAACASLGPVLKDGALVIVESTIAPGTIDRVVRPLLQQTAKGVFYLGACPERVMPGKLLSNLRTLSRVCGGSTPETAETMIELYRLVVHADLDAADPVTAELVKTTENAYRDVQIAFANEVALICEGVGADVWRVRELVNKSPNRQMHLPGAGVGGHCIPKDPWLLAYGADEKTPMRLIPTARAVNDAMPLHVADLVQSGLEQAGRKITGARIAVLGYSYLEDSDDTRNSPSEVLVTRLRELGADVVIQDPWVAPYQGDVLDCARGCDAVVVMVAHRAYKALDLAALKAVLRTPVLVDGRHVFDAGKAAAVGLRFRGVGQGTISA